MTNAAERHDELYPLSASLFRDALNFMPSGNTRHTVFYPPFPLYMHRGVGCRLEDVDGNERIDFVNNYSSLIHGHANPAIVEALTGQVRNLLAVGAPTGLEIRLAKTICARVPSIERIRFANSGTEAVMLAVQAARACTRRTRIAKVEGCYHGTYDPVQVSITSDPETWGNANAPRAVPVSLGTPPSVLEDVVVLPLNDLDASVALLRAHAAELAAVIVDPLPSRLNFIRPDDSYLLGLREETRRRGQLFIADEVYSFRLAAGGRQTDLGLDPDLTCLGKVIGGGTPIGALGGSAGVMSVFDLKTGSPKTAHLGTFNANPPSMAAGQAALAMLDEEAISRLNDLGAYARQRIAEEIERHRLTAQVTGLGSFIGLHFNTRPLRDYRSFRPLPAERAAAVFLHRFMLDNGIFCAPSINFNLSTPMTNEDVDALVDVLVAGLSRVPHEAAR